MVKNMTEKSENERIVKNAWLFDVDGVITHPEQKKVTELGILDEIIKRLELKEPVAFVTGRSLSWMIERVVKPLEKRVNNKAILQNFFGLGEKGGAWLTYGLNNQRVESTDRNLHVPGFLQEKVRTIVEAGFANTMFFDNSKKTMISIEMRDGMAVQQYQPKQQVLSELLIELLKKYGLSSQFKVDQTRIAIDVENKNVGKALGSAKFLKWLKDQRVKAQNFIAFGDSKSDVSMASFIHEQGLPVVFVFVGEKELLADQPFSFPVVFTTEHCEKGTLEYLTSKTFK